MASGRMLTYWDGKNSQEILTNNTYRRFIKMEIRNRILVVLVVTVLAGLPATSFARYVQPDPIGQLKNTKGMFPSDEKLNHLYGYVSQNPINKIDPYGLVEWNGLIESGGLSIVVGAAVNVITLTSECVDGKRAHVKISTVGPMIGVGGKASVSGSEITVNDKHDTLRPDTFRGWFVLNSVGGSVGPLGFGGYQIQIGGNGSRLSPTGAYGSGFGWMSGWGYGISGNPGSAIVEKVSYSSCKCE